MSSNVVNFPSEYLVCLQPDIWKTLLQGTSQIKINLSGCSMITKSFQKFGESSLKTVLWPPAIKLEFQPMCSLRLETYLYLYSWSSSVLLFFCIMNGHFLFSKLIIFPVVKTISKSSKFFILCMFGYSFMGIKNWHCWTVNFACYNTRNSLRWSNVSIIMPSCVSLFL